MVIGVHKRAIGVFSNRRDAEKALYELRESGFPIDRVSVIKRDADQNDDIAGAEVRESVGNKSEEGATVGAVSGGVLGGLTGLLVGLGTLAIPGIGPIMLAGATATALATTVAGAGIGAAAGSLLGGLIGLGIPEERARVYNERVERGDYLVIIDGTDAEIARAEEILKRQGIEEFDVYDQPGVTTGTGNYVPTTVAAAGVLNRDNGPTKHAVGYFCDLNDAEAAIHDLRTAGFPLSQISLVHRDLTRREPFAGVDLRDRIDATRFRFPDARTRFYNERINHGDYVVIVSGTDDEIHRAAAILGRHKIQNWEIHDPSVIGPTKHAVGYFSGLNDAEAAIHDLRTAGFPLSQISLVHRDLSRKEPFAGVDFRDRIDTTRFRFPDARTRFYNERINHGDYVVIVSGTDDEIHRAAAILGRHKIQNWEIHDPSVVSSTQPVGVGTTPLQTNRRRRAIGVFPHRRDAEAALGDLRDAGFSMNQVSLIAKDTGNNSNIAGANRNLGTGNKADEGAKAGAATGGALGGLGGLLVGLGTLAIPGVGPILAGGAVATALATTLAGGAIGAAAGSLAGGLVGLGIPEDRARVYSDRINKGDDLVIVDGTEDEIRRAEPILKRRGIQEFDIFDATNTHGVHHQGYDRGVRHDTPGVNTTLNERPVVNTSPTGYDKDDPAVIIIDHRNETV
ncbi:MAG: general stress protein [Brasilonema sp.]